MANGKAFFNSGQQLATLFGPSENFHNPETMGKYMEDGQKPIEAFCNDILKNLVEWAVHDNSIFYKTQKHWYEFRLETAGKWEGVVWMTRYDHHTWRRLDSWANKSSLSNMGKAFLVNHADKRVPLFYSKD